MGAAIITGHLGLVGSYVAEALSKQGLKVYGIDNDVRAKLFKDISPLDKNEITNLINQIGVYEHYSIDIRDQEKIRETIGVILEKDEVEVVIHCAAQPSHDWASSEPLIDLDINLTSTVNLLESLRSKDFKGVFIFLSTNKVYGDSPNYLPLKNLGGRLDLDEKHTYYKGIDTSLSIDNCLHSLFGCSKAGADLYVQEYSRYFDMKCVILRGGCLTGARHRGAKLHGFLSYLVKTATQGQNYTIIGYDGLQVRDNLHAQDIGELVCKIVNKNRENSDINYPIVSNMGGGRKNSVSVIEACRILKEEFNLKFKWKTDEKARKGDHKWYISDNTTLDKVFGWKPTTSLHNIMKDIIESK